MTNSALRCTGCKDRYPSESDEWVTTPMGRFHTFECAIAYAKYQQESSKKRSKARAEKEQRKKNRERKQALRPRSWYMKEAQKWFNKFIRLRDDKEPCISCGRHHDGQYHAGHYLSTGAHPELRFTEINCHKQCAPCNNHLSGNIVRYRPALIDKIGIDNVLWLEGPHEPCKHSIDDLKEIIQAYKTKVKELEKELEI